MAGRTITQRIALEGGKEVEAALNAIAKSGEQAMGKLKSAAESETGFDKIKSKTIEVKNNLDQLGSTAQKAGAEMRSAFSGVSDAVSAAVSPLKDAFLSIGTYLTVATAGIGALVTAANEAGVAMGKSAAAAAKEISDSADALGVTAESYQRLKAIAEDAGLSTSDLTNALKKVDDAAIAAASGITDVAKSGAVAQFQFGAATVTVRDASKVLGEAGASSKSAADGFKALGLNVQQLANLNAEQKLIAIADAVARMPDGLAKNAALAEIFGDKWRTLLPLLNQGGDAVRAVAEDFEVSSRMMSDAQVAIGKAYTDSATNLKEAIEATRNQIGLLFIEGRTKRNNALAQFLDDTREATVELVKLIKLKTEFFLNETFGGPGNALLFVMGKLVEFGKDLVAVFQNFLLPVLQLIGNGFAFVASKMNEFLGTNVNATQLGIVVALISLSGLFTALMPIIGAATGLVKTFFGTLIAFGPALGPLGLLVIAFWDDIKNGANSSINFSTKKLDEFRAAFKKLFAGDFSGFFKDIAKLGGEAFDFLGDSATEAGKIIGEVFNALHAGLMFVRAGLSVVATVINGVFGTDLTGNMVAFYLILARVTGLLGSLGAVLQVALLAMNALRAGNIALIAGFVVLVRLMPNLNKALNAFADGLSKIFTGDASGFDRLKEGFVEFIDLISKQGIGTWAVLAVAAATAFNIIFGLLETTVTRTRATFGVLSLLTRWPALLAIAVAAGFALVYSNFDELKQAASDLVSGISKLFTGMWKDVFNPKGGVDKGAFTLLGQAFSTLWNVIKNNGVAAWTLIGVAAISTARLIISTWAFLGGPWIWAAFRITATAAWTVVGGAAVAAAARTAAAWAGAQLLGLFGALASAAVSAFGVISRAAIALAASSGALGLLTGWPAVMIAALVLLAAAVYVFWDDITAYGKKKWEEFKKIFQDGTISEELAKQPFMIPGAGATAGWVKWQIEVLGIAKKLWNELVVGSAKASEALEKDANKVADASTKAAESTAKTSESAVNTAATNAKVAAAASKTEIAGIGGTFLDAIGKLINNFNKSLDGADEGLKGLSDGAKKTGSDLSSLNTNATQTLAGIQAAARGLKTEVRDGWEFVRLQNGMQIISKAGSEAFNTLKKDSAEASKTVTENVEKIGESTKKIEAPATNLGDTLKKVFKDLFGDTKQGSEEAKTAVQSVAQETKGVGDQSKAAGDSIKSNIGGSLEAVNAQVDNLKSKWDGMLTSLESRMQAIKAMSQELPSAQLPAAGDQTSYFSNFETAAKAAWDRIKSAAEEAANSVANAFSNKKPDFQVFEASFDGSFSNVENKASSLATKIIDYLGSHLSEGIKSALVSGGVAGTFQTYVIDPIANAIEKLVAFVSEKFSAIGSLIREKVGNLGINSEQFGTLGKLFSDLADQIMKVAENFKQLGISVLDSAQPMQLLKQTWEEVIGTLARVAIAISEVIGGVARMGEIALETAALSALALALGDLNLALKVLGEGLKQEVGQMIEVLKTIIDRLGLFKNELDTIPPRVKQIPIAFKEVGDSADDAAQRSQKAFTGIGDAIAKAFAGILEPVQNIFDDVVASIENAMARAVDVVTSAVQDMISVLADLEAQIQATMDAAASAASDSGGGDSGFATGGFVSGPGSGTSDSIPAWLSNGEFVLKAAAVRKYGLGFLYALNTLRLNLDKMKFASGGLVSAPAMKFGIPAFAGGGLASSFMKLFSGLSLARMPMMKVSAAALGSVSRGRLQPLVLNIGGQSFGHILAPADIAARLQSYAQTQTIRSAGAAPSWKR